MRPLRHTDGRDGDVELYADKDAIAEYASEIREMLRSDA